VRSEVDEDGDLVLDAGDAAETVLVVCYQVAYGESLDWAVGYRDVERASCQVAPCGTGARWFHPSRIGAPSPAATALAPGDLARDWPGWGG
jgi:hypothetical protein